MIINSYGVKTKLLLLSLAVLLPAANGVFAQGRNISFPSGSMTASMAINEIKAQTGYVFAYDKSVYNTHGVVEFGAATVPLDIALACLVNSQNADYIIRNNVVVITPKLDVPEAAQTADPPKTRTADVYKRNAPDAVSADPVVRPVAEAAPELAAPVAVAEDVKEEAKPAVQYSAYEPIDTYGHVRSATPRFALKTNLLYAATTFTPNLAFEFGLNGRSTLEISGSYNWMGRTAAASANHRQRVHMIIRPEYRRWLCERYNGHFFGVHAIYARYNISGYDIPLLFDKESRYDGHAYGAGAAYGYHWAFAKRWGAEFNIGLGYMYMDYEQYGCAKCETAGTPRTKHYFGPTRAGITLVFMIK